MLHKDSSYSHCFDILCYTKNMFQHFSPLKSYLQIHALSSSGVCCFRDSFQAISWLPKLFQNDAGDVQNFWKTWEEKKTQKPSGNLWRFSPHLQLRLAKPWGGKYLPWIQVFPTRFLDQIFPPNRPLRHLEAPSVLPLPSIAHRPRLFSPHPTDPWPGWKCHGFQVLGEIELRSKKHPWETWDFCQNMLIFVGWISPKNPSSSCFSTRFWRDRLPNGNETAPPPGRPSRDLWLPGGMTSWLWSEESDQRVDFKLVQGQNVTSCLTFVTFFTKKWRLGKKNTQLVGGWTTHLKNIRQNWMISPIFVVFTFQKYLSCRHHLVIQNVCWRFLTTFCWTPLLVQQHLHHLLPPGEGKLWQSTLNPTSPKSQGRYGRLTSATSMASVRWILAWREASCTSTSGEPADHSCLIVNLQSKLLLMGVMDQVVHAFAEKLMLKKVMIMPMLLCVYPMPTQKCNFEHAANINGRFRTSEATKNQQITQITIWGFLKMVGFPNNH